MNADCFTVLVVDDNPADRLVYRMALLSNPGGGFQVSEADDGKAGLESCKAHVPDCILLDFNMPDVDGLRFMSLVKEHFGDLPCAVVMLTGARDELLAVRAIESGATDYLPKTQTTGDHLAHSVISAIEKFRMRRQILDQQSALAASELRYRTLMESLPQLVWLADSDGRIRFANRPCAEFMGLTSLEDPGAQEALFGEDRERFAGLWREAVDANRGFEIELGLRRPVDGAERCHLVRVAPIQNGAGETSWLGTAMDIEDLQRAQRAVQKKQKWESIGLLAGGIAHDFNNLLVGILGGASVLAESLPAGDETQSTLKMIIQSSERAALLTEQLLAYSGKAQLRTERVDLSNLVRKTCDLIHSSVPSHIQLLIRTANPPAVIEADAGQIQQVITNLVMNALEAIPEGERGTVTVGACVGDWGTGCLLQDYAGRNTPTSGACAVLEVQDTGSGMNAETRGKIFDPFFTTKFLGRGLGLAAVQGIVRSARGRILVDSEPGKGSTFRIFLPIAQVMATTERPGHSAEIAPGKTSGGTILVIDDEPAVRRMISMGLGRAGHAVLTAEDGPSGLRILAQRQDSISLVLLDMGMPQMGGEEVLRTMRALGCQVPVALCSGYSEAEVLTRIAGREFIGIIQKPFRLDELVRRVRDLLRAVAAGYSSS